MSIKRYFATADNTISNAFDESLVSKNSATGSNMGASDILETFSLYGQVSSSTTGVSSELSRIIIKFNTAKIASDRAAGLIPASGNVSFYLNLYNARHSSTLPENYDLLINAVSGNWQEGTGLDMVNYTDQTLDLTGSSWVNARASGTLSPADNGKWSSTGGDYYGSPTFTQTFYEGYEDLNVDVTLLVEQWLAGTKVNDGFGIRFTDSFENAKRSYYTKKFFARGSEFFFKRPTIEARWNSTRKDNRGDFYFSSSLAPASDNLNTIYLYNVIRGRLRNIPSIGEDTIRVSIFSGSSANTAPDENPLRLSPDATFVRHAAPLVVTGGYVSTGVYSASFAFTGSTSIDTIYDVWFSGSDAVSHAAASNLQFATGSIKTNSFGAEGYISSEKYVISISNLRKQYGPTEKARFKLYARPKSWSPTIYSVAKDKPENTNIQSASYEIFRVSDNLKIVPFGTGSDLHTLLSCDVSGNYFDFDMSNLESGYSYGIRFSFYDEATSNWNDQPYEFRFKVRQNEY